jgi:ribosomal protein S18 acetylase RimI-like enzyme
MCRLVMRIEPFREDHVPCFLRAADSEGWISDRWELSFLLKSFPEGCRTALRNGNPAGFVTSVCYDRSGWIGNLLVRKEMRGQGLGRALFEGALQSLEFAGADTVWLTASADGQPLYEKLGFAAIDRITRWRSRGIGRGRPYRRAAYELKSLEETDLACWGDRRSILLSAVAERGMVIVGADGFCIVRRVGERVQIGPWACRRCEGAGLLLQEGVAVAPLSAEIVLDVPASNGEAAVLLAAEGFSPVGSTALMYRGAPPAYAPDMIFAMASLGSMG